jgi:hypothetical protein
VVSTQYRDLRAGTKETWASVHDDGSARPANMWESRNTKFGSASNGSASPCSLKTVDNSGCPYDDGSIPLPAFSPVTSSLTMQTDPVNFRSQSVSWRRTSSTRVGSSSFRRSRLMADRCADPRRRAVGARTTVPLSVPKGRVRLTSSAIRTTNLTQAGIPSGT